MSRRLKESFLSRSYNNVPPVIMELMKDMRGFAAAVVQRVGAMGTFHPVLLGEGRVAGTPSAGVSVDAADASGRGGEVTGSRSRAFRWRWSMTP